MESLKSLLTMQGLSEQSFNGMGAMPMSQKEHEQSKVDTYNAEEGELNLQDGYDCRVCKNKGFIAKLEYNENFGYWHETLYLCKCNKARGAIRRLARSGLKDVAKKYSFATYEAKDEWQKTIKAKAEDYLETVVGGGWFFIGGQSGAGKTHICTAIAVQCIKRCMSVKYMLWRDEIARIKAIVNEPDLYKQAMDELKLTDVLYIDDIFKGGKDDFGKVKPPTAADINAAFEILNYRYNTGKATIISSERTLDDLNDIDEAIAGRIAEKSKPGGHCISLRRDPKKNWRMNGITEL